MTDPTSDAWIPILRSLAGNDVEFSPDDCATLHYHVVIARESALVGQAGFQSLDGLPDSDTVAHWHDGHLIDTAEEQQRRFDQAVAMAVGLNEWEAIQ